MRYLLDIIVEHKDTLPPPTLKIANQFYNKIKGGAYLVNSKNIVKLEPFATPEFCDFLLFCINRYDEMERRYYGHHDPISLQAAWAVLAFSKEEKVLDYFKKLILGESQNKRFYLSRLLPFFRHEKIDHPYKQMLMEIYENLFPQLASYQLIKALGIEPPDPFDWSVMIELINFGKWYTTNGLSEEEMEKQYHMVIYFGSPSTLNSTFKIDIQNSLSLRRKRISFEEFSDSGVFTINVDETAFEAPDLCKLDFFLKEVQSYFNTSFETQNPAYVSVTKGMNRKKIVEWVKSGFRIEK